MGTLNSPTAPGQPKKDSASAAQESAECSSGGACNHVGEAGEDNGEYCWPDRCIPDGCGNGQQETRICHVAEVEGLQGKRPPEAPRRQKVPQDHIEARASGRSAIRGSIEPWFASHRRVVTFPRLQLSRSLPQNLENRMRCFLHSLD